MKKKYIFGLIIILIFGVFMAFRINKDWTKYKEEFRERQERLALYFVNNYELANGEEIKEIKITSFKKDFMTGYSRCIFLINGKYYASVSENYETREIGGASYDKEIESIKPPKNNTKLEAKIEYFED